jgi:hypothetical protein
MAQNRQSFALAVWRSSRTKNKSPQERILKGLLNIY